MVVLRIEGRRFVGPHRLGKVQRAILCAMLFLLVAGSGSAENQSGEGRVGIEAESFRCITEMTHVRQFYVDNLLGNLDATLDNDLRPAVIRSTSVRRWNDPPSQLRSTR